MPTSIRIRKAGPNDYDAIADVVFDAVRNGPSAYSEEQRRAWMPRAHTGVVWRNHLDSQTIFVAENVLQMVGIMSLAKECYIDFAFIRPVARGTGVFRRLFEEVENLALQTRQTRLWVHASLTAQPAFTAMGFSIIQKETVERGDQLLDRFEMEKRLNWIDMPSLL